MAQDEDKTLWYLCEDSKNNKMHFDSFTAASNGDLSYFTKYIVGSTENFSCSNKSGWTPIMYACARGHALLVSYLVMCGVKTSCSSKSKITPLMLAVASGDLPTVECVFNASDLESKDYKKWTALFYAIYFLQEKCVRYLLSKGANVNIQDFQNETPLLIAIKSGNESIVNMLLKTANNLHIISHKNESAVMLAKESGNEKIRNVVLDRSEHLKKESSEYETPRKRKFGDETPSPFGRSPKMRNFLGLRISKSFTYSPNRTCKITKLCSQYNSPIPTGSDHVKRSFWKMCITTNPIPTEMHYDVEKLLSSLGLEKYWPIFRDEEVDFETLLTFSEENLKEIGIAPFGPRKKILSAIQNLRIYYNT